MIKKRIFNTKIEVQSAQAPELSTREVAALEATPQQTSSRRSRRRARPGTSKRSRGSVILIVAGGMVALCGFCALAVDFGRSVATKNHLQRASDAAALAGSQYLPADPTGARAAAVYIAYQNGVVINPDQVQITNNNARIAVPATRNVKYLFAPVMKIISGDVNARAVAAKQRRDNFRAPDVVPIGITPTTYFTHLQNGTVGTEIGIRQNFQTLGTDNFVLFDLRAQNSKSPAWMQRQLEWNTDFDETTVVGNTETTLNAANNSQAKKFEDGMLSRFNAAAGAPWHDNGDKYPNIPQGSPRMMYFIVTPEQQPINGNNNAPVIAIVPVYVEGITVSGSEMNMRVRMLPMTYGQGGEYQDADGSSDQRFTTARLVG